MNDTTNQPEPAYHLLLDPEEVPVTAGALDLLISDEAHEPDIRRLAWEVLGALRSPADELGVVTVALSPQQMKITHSALKGLLNDLQRGQADEREILWHVLEKLPDEHSIRAIELD
jgi:hypothetical protein